MQEFKGTPGEFKACTEEANWYGFENRFFEVIDKDNMIVVFVKDWDGAGNTPKRDATLLAAAPKLLATLQTVKSEVGHFLMQQNPELLSEIDEAINKALSD